MSASASHSKSRIYPVAARLVLGLLLASLVVSACATPTPQVVVETQLVRETVEVEVEVEVKETVPVEVNVVVTATPEPLPAVTLRAAHYAKWDSFNPLIGAFGGNQVDTAHRVFSALVAQQPNGKIFGDLAEDWTVSADGKTYTFNLREGVKWHDGEPFTAEDVVFTFELVANPATGSTRSSTIERIVGAKEFTEGSADSIAGIKAVDDTTVEMQLTDADAYFLVVLAGIPIEPKHILDSVAPADIASSDFSLKSPIGTGPYKLVNFDSVNQVVTYEAYQDYHWGVPKISTVQWVWIAQPDAQIVAFEKGEIDYAPWHIWNEGHFKQAIGIPTLQNIPIAWGNVGGIVINTSQPYFADPRIRQAMFQAIDRRQFLAVSGYNKLYTGFFDLASWAKNPEVNLSNMYPYDPEAARELLEAAGWDFNREVVLFTTVTGADPTRLAIQQMLGAVGMKVKLEQVEVAVVDKAMHQDRPPTYDLYITGMSLSDPGLAIAQYLRCDAPGNFFGYCNPELDALSEQDQSATTTEKRVEILSQIEALIAADPMLIPLTYSPQYVGFSTRCSVPRYAWYTFEYMHEWTCTP